MDPAWRLFSIDFGGRSCVTRLNGAEIHARFQQVRGESVPQGVGVDGLIFAAFRQALKMDGRQMGCPGLLPGNNQSFGRFHRQ